MPSNFEEWFNSIPRVTRSLLVTMLIVTVAGNFHILPIDYLYLSFEKVFFNFQIWRIVSNFFFLGKLDFGFLIELVFVAKYSQALEAGVFAGQIADYVFMLLFTSLQLLIAGFLFEFFFLAEPLVFVIIYNWAQHNKNAMMTFFGLFNFPGAYFPWFLLLIRFLMGGSIFAPLVGIVIGHVYYFLKYIYKPGQYLKTPRFLYKYFPPAYANRQGPPQQQQPVNWGRGQQLGRN